jgi:hypothetical protein
MSVTDLKVNQDAFFEKKRLWKVGGRTSVHVSLFRAKVYNFGGILYCKNKQIYFIFQHVLFFN